MLGYDRINVSEGNNVNKSSGLIKSVICHYWYFLDVNLKFQWEVRNGCHGLMQKTMNLNDFVTGTVKGNDYRIFLYMNNDEAIHLSRNFDLTEKNRALSNINIYYHIQKCVKKL